MLPVILTLLAITISVIFFKPYLRTPQQRRTLFKFGLILLPLSIIGYLVVTYINYDSKPDSFRRGVELLQNDKDIQSKIGIYDSYSYFDKDIPKKDDNPAKFKVELTGSLASIYLYCEVQKDTKGKWHILKVKQDSLVKDRHD
jgi:hypothetical protein